MQPHPSPAPLAPRAALVTGAGSGIGRATAIRLAPDGARLVACLDRHGETSARTTTGITAAGGTAIALEVDVTDAAVAADGFAAAAAEQGAIDILVHNAGIPGSGRFADTTIGVGQVLSPNGGAAFRG